ncbi:hypothetical protein TRSC58_06736 [Trypanosoma rangeli SC58]|uniref:C2 domain-containing protein n=1 Tax=Trypanosoma rangeli SC58 TaxID=429131 RepID=A0A061IS87_TRYRA|nr:hypothetical protein TRSC58_06736 [Trypanosoma rangeli SC58]
MHGARGVGVAETATTSSIAFTRSRAAGGACDEQVGDVLAELGDTPVMVSASASVPAGSGAVRWALFVDMAPWKSYLLAAEAGMECASPGEAGDDAYKAAESLWRMALCKEDGRVLAGGSSFCSSVCSSQGWSDLIVVVGDDIVAAAVVSLELQALLPVGVGADAGDKRDIGFPMDDGLQVPSRPRRWTPVATSALLPVAKLLVFSADARVCPVSLYVGAADNSVAASCWFPFQAGEVLKTQAALNCLSATVGASDTAGWMQAQQRVAAECHVEMLRLAHGSHSTEEQLAETQRSATVYSVALHVCFAVLQQLCCHVDAGAAYPPVALTISGGCESLLQPVYENDEANCVELRQVPVIRFDARVQTTLDEAHPVLLLTLHSPVAPEVVLGRAVLSVFDLLLTSAGRLWLPLRSDRELDSEAVDDGGSDDRSYAGDSQPVGWMHCGYACILLSEECAASVVSVANYELLQQPQLLPALLSVPKYLSSPAFNHPLRWNCLQLCIVEAVDFCGELVHSGRWKQARGVYARANVLPPPRAVAYADTSTLTDAFTTPIVVSNHPRWVCNNNLVIATDTTHLLIRLFDDIGDGAGHPDGGTECLGVIDIPRVATSRFWVTSAGEAWLPIVPPRRRTSTCYRGAVLLRWEFSSRDDPSWTALRGIGADLCPSWSSFTRLQPHGMCWVQIGPIELMWTWLPHCTAWRASAASAAKRGPGLFLRLRAGHFMHELPLRPSRAGDCCITVHGAVFFPLTDHVEVDVCCCHDPNSAPADSVLSALPFFSSEAASKAVAVVGGGELLLLDEARANIALQRPHQVVIRIEPRAMYPPCAAQTGLLTAQLHAVRIAQQKEVEAHQRPQSVRWTWPPPLFSTVVELRLMGVVVMNARVPLILSSRTLSPPRWVVVVREKAGWPEKSRAHGAADTSPAEIIHPPVTLNAAAPANNDDTSARGCGGSLYLQWPPPPFTRGLHLRPPPPIVELLLSREVTTIEAGGASETTEFVGSVTLDLSHCFEGASGTLLCPLRRSPTPQDTTEGERLIGFVELHFAHNFVQEDVGVEATATAAPAKTVGCDGYFVMTVVKARYRQREHLLSSPQTQDAGASRTSFVVEVGGTSWRTTPQTGMTPQFDCQMVFELPQPSKREAGEELDDMIKVQIQMLPESLISDDDSARTGMTWSPRFAAAFAFLRLRCEDVIAAGGVNAHRWVPLYTSEDNVGDVRILAGEVLVRWGWFPHFSCAGVTPLSVCTVPSPAVQQADDVATLTSAKGTAGVSSPPPPPSHLWVQVCDFVVLDGSLLETASRSKSSELLFVVCVGEASSFLETSSSSCFPPPHHDEDDHQRQELRSLTVSAARYGDCTGGAVLDVALGNCVWMEYCLLPLLLVKDLGLRFYVRSGSGTHVVGSGCLTHQDSIGRWKTAVGIFAVGATQPCGVLTVALAQAPLYGESMVVSSGQPREWMAQSLKSGEANQPEPETGGELKGVECPQPPSVIGAPELALLRITVHTVELYGRSVLPFDSGWELTLRSDMPCAAGDTYQWTRLEAKQPLRGGPGEEWVGGVCAQSGSTMEVSLVRRIVAGGRGLLLTGLREVHGRFVVCFDPHLGEDSGRHFDVELLRSAPSGPFKGIPVPVGRLCVSCHPLMRSGVLCDPRSVFFRRRLHLAVSELLGVVRAEQRRFPRPRQSSNNATEVSDTETTWVAGGAHGDDYNEEEACVCMRLQCGAAAVVSSRFAPPRVVAGSNRRKTQLDGTHNCSVSQFPLLQLDCDPGNAGDAAAVRLSLHLCLVPPLPKRLDEVNALPGGVLIGEAVTFVPSPGESEDENWSLAITAAATTGSRTTAKVTGDAASLWVPILATGVKSTQTAYAHLQYAWSCEVDFGSWLACIRIRSLGRRPTLHRPFLCFFMRFPNGVELRLPLDLFGTLPTLQPSRADHAAVVETPLLSIWSFSHIQLPVVWPLGAQVEAVELHDRVAPGLSIHVGTHPWTSNDTPLLALLRDDSAGAAPLSAALLLSSFFTARWLRFTGVDTGAQGGEDTSAGAHEILLARSVRPPGGVGVTRDLRVPFRWWPLHASLRLTVTGHDLAALGAGRLAVSCRFCLGCWQAASTTTAAAADGWVWEGDDAEAADEFRGDEVFATHIEVKPSTAAVTATWGTAAAASADVAGGGGVFTRYLSVERLREGAVRHAVSVSVVCYTRGSSASVPESTAFTAAAAAVAMTGMTAIYTCEGIFVVDDSCTSTRGESRLLLREGGEAHARRSDASSEAANSLTMAWAIAHDQLTLCASTRDASPAAALCNTALESLEKRRWRLPLADDARRQPAMPSWLVTSVDVRNLSVVLPWAANTTVTTFDGFTATGRVSPRIPLVAHLAAQRRRRRPRRRSPALLKEEQEEEGPKFGARFPLISVNATPINTRQLRPLYALHMEPMWCVEPQEWVDHRRPLNLTLWQVLSSAGRRSCALGTMRLDAVLRDAFAQLPTGVGSNFSKEVLTEWQSLSRRGLQAQDVGSVRLKCLPVMCSPSKERVSVCQVPVCVELLQITAHSFRGSPLAKPGVRLGLAFSPAGNTRFTSCSTTYLLPGGVVTHAAAEKGSSGDHLLDGASDGDSPPPEEEGEGNREKMRRLHTDPTDDDHAAARGGDGVRSEELVALSTFHSLLLEGREMNAGAEQGTQLHVDVFLVECRSNDRDVQENVPISRDDIARVLAAGQLDLRSLPHLPTLSGNTKGADSQSLQSVSAAGTAAPPLYGAFNFTLMLSYSSSLIVTVRLHVVVLAATPHPFYEGDAGSSEEDAAAPCACARFFCAAYGHGEDSSGPCTGLVAAVGGKVYRVGRRVWEWDACELQRVRSSCAVAFSLPRLRCFKWRAVKVREGEVPQFPPFLWQRDPCVGQAVWVYDNRYIMLYGGLRMRQRGVTPRPPPKNGGGQRRRHRSCRVVGDVPPNHHTPALVHDAVANALPCYDTKEHVWGVVDTEGGDEGGMDRRDEKPIRQHVFHSAVLMHEKVWCFGGCRLTVTRHGGGNGPGAAQAMFQEAHACQEQLSNTLRCLDLPTRQWRTVEPAAQMASRAMRPDHTRAPFAAVKSPLVSSPPPLGCHTAVGWNNQMFVFGGLEEVMEGDAATLRPSNALYVFHTIQLSWWLLSPPPAADVDDGGRSSGKDDEGWCRNWPSARYGHASAVVPENPHGAFLVLGGATRLAANAKSSRETALRCMWDDLLWVYYAALGYWQRINVPSCVPLTRRVFSSLQIVRATGEPWVSYVAVVAGGYDALCLEQLRHAEEEENTNSDSGAVFAIDGKADVGREQGAAGAAARPETMQRVLATVLTSPQWGTAWVSLEERGCWHVSSRNRR